MNYKLAIETPLSTKMKLIRIFRNMYHTTELSLKVFLIKNILIYHDSLLKFVLNYLKYTHQKNL